jgi:acetyl-CoA synthetase
MNQIANMLKAHGIKKGDCVAFYVQASFHCVAALLACSRIGATFTFVFAEFPIPAIVYRINEAECAAVITDNQGLRCGKRIELKKIADEAINECPTVKHTFVINRTDSVYETNERVVDLLKVCINFQILTWNFLLTQRVFIV